VVALAESIGRPLNELSLDELRSCDPRFDADALAVFDLATAMRQRTLPGSPGVREVRKQLRRWQRLLKPPAPKKARR
jgi:argininosuccinate lyase